MVINFLYCVPTDHRLITDKTGSEFNQLSAGAERTLFINTQYYHSYSPYFLYFKMDALLWTPEGNIITQHLLHAPALPRQALSDSATTNQVSSARLLLPDHNSPLGRTVTGSYFHENGSAKVCKGKQKHFTVMPECGRRKFTPPTHLTAFGLFLHKGQLQINQAGYAGTKCVSVTQQTLIF